MLVSLLLISILVSLVKVPEVTKIIICFFLIIWAWIGLRNSGWIIEVAEVIIKVLFIFRNNASLTSSCSRHLIEVTEIIIPFRFLFDLSSWLFLAIITEIAKAIFILGCLIVGSFSTELCLMSISLWLIPGSKPVLIVIFVIIVLL